MEGSQTGIRGMHNRTPIFSRYVFFSVTLFLTILIVGSVTFLFSMRQIIRNSKAAELCLLLDIEKIKLEASVNREITIVLRMAGSPLIRNYFENPDDSELRELALNEINACRNLFVSGTSFFWINDNDKLFYIDDQAPYRLDTSLSGNYWYSMTLNETEVYNFNINYNPDLNVTNIWINAPIRNSSHKPVGMLGIGTDLSAFVNTLYKNYRGKASLYFFNSKGEITGAGNTGLVAAKKNINEELGCLNEDVLAIAKTPEHGKAQLFTVPKGQAAVISIPLLEWYAVAIWPDSIDDFKTALTALFFMEIIVVALILAISCFFVFNLLSSLRKAMTSIEEQNQIIMSGINYANKIQRHLLPSEKSLANLFDDYSVIWKPRDVVSGDIYWVKQFDKGSVLCVCDCTGHGTSGALLTMLVVSALESIIWSGNCDDTAGIVLRIDERLKFIFNAHDSVIKDGCDLVVMFISNDGSITFSSGHTNVFVCNGKEVQRIKGQNIFIGEGSLKNAGDIKKVHINADSENKIYIASDGLFDQPGGEPLRPFGYRKFQNLILENHGEKQSVITEKIWKAFEKHRGAEPRVDDFELITFKPRGN